MKQFCISLTSVVVGFLVHAYIDSAEHCYSYWTTLDVQAWHNLNGSCPFNMCIAATNPFIDLTIF